MFSEKEWVGMFGGRYSEKNLPQVRSLLDYVFFGRGFLKKEFLVKEMPYMPLPLAFMHQYLA